MSAHIVRFREVKPTRADNPDPSIPAALLEAILPPVYLMMGPPGLAGPEHGGAAIAPHRRLMIGIVEGAPGKEIPLHAHIGSTEIFVCLTGRFNVRWRDERGEAEAVLDPLDLVSVPAGVYRELVNITAAPALLLGIIAVDDGAEGDEVVMAPEVSKAVAERAGVEMLAKIAAATGYRWDLSPERG